MNAFAKMSSDDILQREWMRLRPLILKAAKFTDGMDEADLLRGVVAGVYSFWPGNNAFILASIDRLPKLTRLNLFLAGGDHNEVSEIEPEVIAWAKTRGATESYTEARIGLDRLNERGQAGYYSGRGYKRHRIVYRKAI